jgi:hypothetical protein
MNGRVRIAEGSRNVTRMDAAQYCMLTKLHSQDGQNSPTAHLLKLSGSNLAQLHSGLEHIVHWSRRLIADIPDFMVARLLVCASTMTYNQHYELYVSQNAIDGHIGALVTWPQVLAVLLLYSFLPCPVFTPAPGCIHQVYGSASSGKSWQRKQLRTYLTW